MNSRSWCALAVALAGAAVASCSGSVGQEALPRSLAPAGVSFAVDQGPYTEGDTILLVLEQRGGGRIGFNLCHARLEQRVGDTWRRVPRHSDPSRYCYDDLTVMPSGGSWSEFQTILNSHEEGVYRFRAEIVFDPLEPSSRRVEVVSNGFLVR